MMRTRRRQQKYRHVAPALALMTTVVVAMAGITFSRLSHIPAETPASVATAVVRVRLVGVQRAEATTDISARPTAPDATPRVTTVAALSAHSTAVTEQAASASVADPATPTVVAEPPTLPLSPATLLVGLAAARSRSLASAPPRPAPAAKCGGPVLEDYDADIAGMTGLPERKMYYARRAKKNAPASSCRRPAQTASSTP